MNPITYNIQKFNEDYKELKSIGGGYKYIPTLFDFLISAVRFGASASDYFDFEFFDKTAPAKKRFACYMLKRKFFHVMNDYSKSHIFDNKAEFLKVFQDFLGRDWLDLTDADETAFHNFVGKHTTFMVKHQTGSCGSGISKVRIDEKTDIAALYKELKAENCLLEEVLVQHHAMDRLYPNCINSIRVATVKINDEMQILGASLRCGNGSGDVDNFNHGGIAAKIDPESGIVISDAVNRYHQRFYKHPTSGVLFHGFQIPHWDLVIETVTKAMDVVDGVRYIGWDVAIREKDVVLIEGNFEGMFGLLQIPANQGIKAQIESTIRQVESEVAQ